MSKYAIKFRDEEGNHDGLTEQHHKSACDIDNILRQHDQTGLITHVSRSVAAYGDFTGTADYQEALHIVMRAEDAFSQLPSDVRKRFENNPGKFFEFATDETNTKEMIEMGLADYTPESQAIIKQLEAEKAAKSTAEDGE